MNEERYRIFFEQTVREMQATATNFALQMEVDSATRNLYITSIREASTKWRQEASSGAISWKRADEEASFARNEILDQMRGRSSPIGRAAAEKMKAQGKTLNEMIARKTVEIAGPNAQFDNLSQTQKNQIYRAVVESAGKSNAGANAMVRRLTHTTRSLLFVSLAISAYNIYVAEDKLAAAGEEAAIAGSGVAGGIAGGALAGLACGPGAPACVAIGAFVGGAAAAFGVSWFVF